MTRHDKNIFYAILDCQDLIYRCLRIDPSQRIELEDILHHPWMVQSCPSNMEDEDGSQNLKPKIAASAPSVAGFSQVS